MSKHEPTIKLKDADFANHGCELQDIILNPGVELAEIEVRPVTRYIVKRFVRGKTESEEHYGGTTVVGEFDNPVMADQVAKALTDQGSLMHSGAKMGMTRMRRTGMSLGEVISGQRLPHKE